MPFLQGMLLSSPRLLWWLHAQTRGNAPSDILAVNFLVLVDPSLQGLDGPLANERLHFRGYSGGIWGLLVDVTAEALTAKVQLTRCYP